MASVGTAPPRRKGRPADCDEVRDRPGCRCPLCLSRHRTWYKVAECRFKRGLLWVSGNPPADGGCAALVSFCGHPGYPGPCVTVTLWESVEEARRERENLDRTHCGGRCTKRHRVYELGRDDGDD